MSSPTHLECHGFLVKLKTAGCNCGEIRHVVRSFTDRVRVCTVLMLGRRIDATELYSPVFIDRSSRGPQLRHTADMLMTFQVLSFQSD